MTSCIQRFLARLALGFAIVLVFASCSRKEPIAAKNDGQPEIKTPKPKNDLPKADQASSGASTPLLLAAQKGDAEQVWNLINDGVDLEVVDPSGHSAEQVAESNGHHAVATMIACRVQVNRAYELYQNDPKLEDIDTIIVEGEKALKISDKYAIVFKHLTAYYRLKGDQLSLNSGGLYTPDSIAWFEKSLQMGERAIAIDADENKRQAQKQLQAGVSSNDVVDAGDPEIYWNFGLTCMRLGKYPEALTAYEAMRHLAPKNPDSYLSLASVYITSGKTEKAAISLMQALLLDSNRQEALRLLVEIYRQIDKEGCAVISMPGNPTLQLNAECPLVKTNICAAYAGLYRTFIGSKKFKLAHDTRDTAVNNYHCSPDAFATE